MCMARKIIQVSSGVYDALYELKYDWRLRSIDAVIAKLLAMQDIEPFDEMEEIIEV